MHDVLDLHEITHLWPRNASDAEWCEPDERGYWPLIAFIDDGRPVVLEFNVN
jgi:hypothetical protein